MNEDFGGRICKIRKRERFIISNDTTQWKVSFAAFAIDKINAIEGKSRIRILSLLGLAFIGGSVGALLGMYILRHKTRVDYFTVGIPMIMVMQGVVVFFLMNL